MTDKITLPAPSFTRIDEMEGKTIKKVDHAGPDLYILYTDNTVTHLQGGVIYDTCSLWDDTYELPEYVLLALGIIDESTMNAYVDQITRQCEEERKEARREAWLRLKEEFGE